MEFTYFTEESPSLISDNFSRFVCILWIHRFDFLLNNLRANKNSLVNLRISLLPLDNCSCLSGSAFATATELSLALSTALVKVILRDVQVLYRLAGSISSPLHQSFQGNLLLDSSDFH